MDTGPFSVWTSWFVCIRSTEVTSHVKAHRTLHMMRAGGERGQVKEQECMSSHRQNMSGNIKGHSSTEREPRASTEQGVKQPLQSLHYIQHSPQHSSAEHSQTYRMFKPALLLFFFFKLQYSHRKIHISVIKVYRFLNVSTLCVPLNMK